MSKLNDVGEFQSKILGRGKLNTGDIPNWDNVCEFTEHMEEELREFRSSCCNKYSTAEEAVDALFDMEYLILGMMWKMGITQEMRDKIFGVIHNCNMEKVRGVHPSRGYDNDAIKPEGWVGPEEKIREILNG